MATKEELQARSEQIRNEKGEKKNTAERVGSLFLDLVNYIPDGGSGIQSIQEGDGITVDSTDTLNPIISSNGIPLTGTEVGKPVTGPIEISGSEAMNGLIKKLYEGAFVEIGFSDDNFPTMKMTSPDGVSSFFVDNFGGVVQSTFEGATGLRGGSNFVDNYPTDGSEDTIFPQIKYVKKGMSYSTDETRTGGTWIDGKPIYRKVFTGISNDNSGSYEFDFTDLNIDSVLPSTNAKKYNLNFDETEIDWGQPSSDFNNTVLSPGSVFFTYNFPLGSEISKPSYQYNSDDLSLYQSGFSITSNNYIVALDGTETQDSPINFGFCIILEYTKTTD